MEVANKLVNNSILLSVFLVGSFGALNVRSWNQQSKIEALEAEKASLIESNKATKRTMWDWKQQLYAEAATDKALVPLARLKAIHGEAPAAVNEDLDSGSINIVV